MEWSVLLQRSYSPYSGAKAACIVTGKNGLSYPGVRIESISFPDTIHELQVGLYSCLSEGDRPDKVLLPTDSVINDDVLSFFKNEYDLKVTKSAKPDSVKFYNATLSEIADTSEELIGMIDRAVVPNSHFPVAALLETEKGFVGGVNIECSEWHWGLCAERIALCKAIASGITGFKALNVHAKYGKYGSPCGACRQVLIEHMPNKPVYLLHGDKSHSRHLCRHLLPYSFTSSELKKF